MSGSFLLFPTTLPLNSVVVREGGRREEGGKVRSNHPELVKELYILCYLCGNVVREGCTLHSYLL